MLLLICMGSTFAFMQDKQIVIHAGHLIDTRTSRFMIESP
jgi:hypothetical protein